MPIGINRSWYPEASISNPYFTGAGGQFGTRRTWSGQNASYAQSAESTQQGGQGTVNPTEQAPTGPSYGNNSNRGGNDYAISYPGNQEQSSEEALLSGPLGWLYKAMSSYQAAGGGGGQGNYDGRTWQPAQGETDQLNTLQESFRRLMGSMSTTGQGVGLGLLGDYLLPWYNRTKAMRRPYGTSA